MDPHATTAYSIQANGGVQREFGRGLVLTADYVMRSYQDVGPLQGVFFLDQNRFNRPKVTGVDPTTGVVSFVRDPVIPLCTPEQARALDPADQCSTGPINVFASGASYRYDGLHVTLEKRYVDSFQFLIGYALSRNTGFNQGGFTSYEDYSLAYGNLPDHRTHRLTVSGVWTAPECAACAPFRRAVAGGWTLSLVSQFLSAPPLDTILNGLDLDGDGISQTLLPGTTRHNTVGQGLDAAGLRSLVDRYNAVVAAATHSVVSADGTVISVPARTPFNQIISPIVLPSTFSNGDTFSTQDLRVTKSLVAHKSARLSVIGEAFNVFNVANLTGYSGVLNQPNYGQPSARVGQVFGSGGPRAIQLAARLQF
ncbi:MAG TPA: hypothetical protein VKE96_04190 [Vicinamibacterales bacterium]|nr:hypothetical protein [Vicinamibacterales bacterium]